MAKEKRHDNYEWDLVYEASPEQKKRRARRNRDRRRAISEGQVSKGSRLDIHHRNHSKLENPVLVDRHKNRGNR